MEKQTRVSKYKELRDEMKEEVAINRDMNTASQEEEDDFLAFMPKQEEKKIEDTLIEPLSYETLDQDSEDVVNALREAKVTVGKERYNTRLDILNKIKQDSSYVPTHGVKEESVQEVQQEEPTKKMSLLERLAAMSPEEDAEELKKYEEELSIDELMKQEKKKARQERKKREEEHFEKTRAVDMEKTVVKEEKVIKPQPIEDTDKQEENRGKLVTILNYVIVVFMAIFLVLVFLIAKQLFF